jgi:hypothetical protein
MGSKGMNDTMADAADEDARQRREELEAEAVARGMSAEAIEAERDRDDERTLNASSGG